MLVLQEQYHCCTLHPLLPVIFISERDKQDFFKICSDFSKKMETLFSLNIYYLVLKPR